MTESGDYLEGDYIRTHEGLYFAVKGSRHPKEKVIAYLRYRPNVKGDREKDGVKYTRMYSIEKTTKFLKEKYPKYLNKISWLDDELQSVPLEDIDTVFKPTPRLKEIIEKIDDTTFDRAHFASYGDFSLIFEVVYYVVGSDYNKYMDIQQAINFEINRLR